MNETGPLNPETIPPQVGKVTDGVFIAGGLGNAVSIDLGDEVVQIDTGMSPKLADAMIAKLAEFTPSPPGAVVYSHGHLGYNFGVPAWAAAAKAAGVPSLPIVAQQGAKELIDRFGATAAYSHLALALKFHFPIKANSKPYPFVLPTETFQDTYWFGEGSGHGSNKGRHVEIFSAPSETGGSIAAWVPDVKTLYGGPSCIWALPDAGLPLRSPRDPLRWASTLRRLLTYDAEILIPQFGEIVRGADEVAEFIGSTIRALQFIHDFVVDQLNAGANLAETQQAITYPDEVFDKPHLNPGYGSHADLVHATWESYAGWWDRNPTHLEPTDPGAAATAVREAIAEPRYVLERAEILRQKGDHKLALHVIDLIALAPGSDPIVLAAQRLKAEICYDLADEAGDFAGQSLYRSCGDIIANPPAVPTGVH